MMNIDKVAPLVRDTADFIRRHGMISPGQKVVCALSGGTDSVCLLSVLASLRQELDFTLFACHYNHHLRGDESDRDEAFARSLCRDMDIPVFTGDGDVSAQAAQSGMGIEETARRMRYEFFHRALEHFGADRLATAHNADDNLETVIMHLARGTGLRGLCGIPPVRDKLIRPILFAPRADIESYCLSRGLDHVEDHTNSDENYTRNRIRARVLPILKEMNPSAAGASVEMCENLRRDEEYLTKAATVEGEISVSALGPKPLGIRKLRDRYESVSGGLSLSSRQLESLWQLCHSNLPSGKMSLPGKIVAHREYDRLIIAPESDENGEFCFQLPENGSVDTGKFLIFCKISRKTPDLKKNKNTFAIKRDMICGTLFVRSRRAGDKLKLPGRPTKSLKKLFIDEKFPAGSRATIPVIATDNAVIAVGGFGVDEAYLPVDGDEIVHITVSKKTDI